MMIQVILLVVLIYLGCGLLFALPFVYTGVKAIDENAVGGSWGFRLIIIPGTMVFWPLLLRKWIKAASPVKKNTVKKEVSS